jgi:hypothetical protein
MALLLGTAPNQVPTNGDLGTMAFQDEAAINVVNVNYTGTLTGGTGVVNLGSGQLVKDASGNLGLGVTPSAWSTVVPALQLGSAGAFLAAQSSATIVRLGVNAYYNGGYLYTLTGAASMYQQAAGTHSWHSAASGTAGNPITFTQAMTLDASGNLSVVGTFKPQQATTAAAPAYVKGAMYFDTTLNKLRIGGVTAWETVTSV